MILNLNLEVLENANATPILENDDEVRTGILEMTDIHEVQFGKAKLVNKFQCKTLITNDENMFSILHEGMRKKIIMVLTE